MFCDGMNKKVYLASAWYDLAMSVPFALPITLSLTWGYVMIPLNAALGFGVLEPLETHGAMFANFYGSIVMLWALLRLYLADVRLAVVDGTGRFLYSIAMINALMHGATPLLWFFLTVEMTFCVLQLAGAVARHRRQAVHRGAETPI